MNWLANHHSPPPPPTPAPSHHLSGLRFKMTRNVLNMLDPIGESTLIWSDQNWHQLIMLMMLMMMMMITLIRRSGCNLVESEWVCVWEREIDTNKVKRGLNSWRALIMLLRTQTTFQPPTRCNCRPHCTCCTLRSFLLVCERERERTQASNEKVCRQIRARTNDTCCAAHFRVTTLYVCDCVLVYVWANQMFASNSERQHRACCRTTCCLNMLDSELGLTAKQKHAHPLDEAHNLNF